MARADFGLSGFLEEAPQLDIGGLLPSTPLTPVGSHQQPLIINAPRAQSALETKYSTYMQELKQQYSPVLIQSMMDFDAQRVRNGQPPLNEAETRSSLQAAATKSQVTKEPKRSISSPLDIAGNAIMDIGDIVKSIPRLPSALYHEGTALGGISKAITSAPNPIAGLLRAPGVRLIPGTFTAGNILAGEPGNLLRHPVFTALDVLPAADALTRMSPAFKAVQDVAEAADRGALPATLNTRDFRVLEKQRLRPITTTLFNKVAPGETAVPLLRNPIGELIDVMKRNRVGEQLMTDFGSDTRDVMFILNKETAYMTAVKQGKIVPANDLQEFAREAYQLNERLNALDPALTEHGAMARIVDAMYEGDPSVLSDTEAAAYQMYRTEYLEPASEWALKTKKNTEYGGEIYDNETGALLLAGQRNVDELTTLNVVRNAVLGGDHMAAIDVLVDRLSKPSKLPGRRGLLSAEERIRSMRAGEIGAKELLLSWRGTRQAIRNAGYDTTVLDDLAKSKMVVKGRTIKTGGGITTPAFRQAILDFQSGRIELPLRPTMTLEQVLAYAKATTKESVAYRDLTRGITRGEWKGVSDALNNLKNIGEDPAFLRGIQNGRDTARLMQNSRFRIATDEGITKAGASLAKIKADNLSARFLPKAQKLSRTQYGLQLAAEHKMIPVEDAWTTERILAAADMGELTDIPGYDARMYRSIQREVARTIMKAKDDGFDPVFVHIVPTNRVESSFRFGENIESFTPASMKARRPDLTPGVQNMVIALNDMYTQFLDEGIREMQLHLMQDNFGYTQAEVNQLTHETARYRAGQSSAFTREGHKTKVINERFRALDPDELGLDWGSPYLNQLRGEDKIFVPIHVYNVLKSLTKSHQILGGVLEPSTKVFRIATTALSLRTQIYNAVGGPIAAELMNPGVLYRRAGEAIRMMKDKTLIPDEMQVIMGSNVRTMLDLDNITKGKVVEGVRKYLVGEKQRAWWDRVQANKIIGQDLSGRFGGMFTKVIAKSYELNGLVDDFTRLVTYMDEYERSIAKGVSHDTAAYRAVGVARRVLQDYLGMTPFERNVIKSVIPFYGFIGHAIRFVMRYPLDHPLRAEFMSKLAAAELEDNNQGLPSRFLAMLFFGAPDSSGNQHALNLGPFNPFGDVANSMTLAGFLGNTNPALQTMFEMVGLTRGTSELYPSLRYDPETGRMEAQHPGLMETLAGNIIPESAGILAMMGMNAQYNDMLRRDPEAAGRYLLSTLTVPIIERQYNVPQEQFAAEIARRKSQESVLADALKSGDWHEAMRYPSLQAYLKALDNMPEDQLAPFRQQDKPHILGIAQQAFAGRAVQVPKITPLADQVMAALNTSQPISGLAAGGALGLNGI